VSEADILKQVHDTLAKLVRPSIPVEYDLWDSASIGAYLKMDDRQVMAQYASRPDFPQAIRLPMKDGGKGRPRWKAAEVIKWVEKYQEKRRVA